MVLTFGVTDSEPLAVVPLSGSVAAALEPPEMLHAVMLVHLYSRLDACGTIIVDGFAVKTLQLGNTLHEVFVVQLELQVAGQRPFDAPLSHCSPLSTTPLPQVPEPGFVELHAPLQLLPPPTVKAMAKEPFRITPGYIVEMFP